MTRQLMPDKGADTFSLRARLHGFRHAGRGLRRLLRDEHNAWLHLAATVGVGVLAAFLPIQSTEWRWLVAAAALVWVWEAFNTAFEALCGRPHPGLNPAIGDVKDLAAGAVLLASSAAALIGLLTLGPPLLRLAQLR